MSLSLIIVAHNEAEHITSTVKSVYSLVDEIILVDADSTDGTEDAVKKIDDKNKLKTYRYDNPPNFIINKQRALEKTTNDWILELDADEIVSPELSKEIERTLMNENDTTQTNAENVRPVAYWIPRLNHLMGKPLTKGGQYPDYTIRLYKKDHARFPVKTIHDQVEVDGLKTVKGSGIITERIGQLTNPIMHFPYRTLVSFFRKWAQYASYDGDEWFKAGMRPGLGTFMTLFIWKPLHWFILTYGRHRGYVDGFPGFIFSLLSAMRYWVSYMRIYERSVQSPAHQ